MGTEINTSHPTIISYYSLGGMKTLKRWDDSLKFSKVFKIVLAFPSSNIMRAHIASEAYIRTPKLTFSPRSTHYQTFVTFKLCMCTCWQSQLKFLGTITINVYIKKESLF